MKNVTKWLEGWFETGVMGFIPDTIDGFKKGDIFFNILMTLSRCCMLLAIPFLIGLYILSKAFDFIFDFVFGTDNK